MVDEGEPSSKRPRTSNLESSGNSSTTEQIMVSLTKSNDPSNSNSTSDDDEDDEEPINRDSLLVLNDDCLRKIFECSELEVYCNLADVCKRLKNLAEDVFGRRFSKIKTSETT